MQQRRFDDNTYHGKGFVTLLGVLIVGAIGTAITLSLLLLGNGASQTSNAFERSQKAKALANACAEHALNELRLSLSYTGNETYTFSGLSCQILPVQGSGNTNRAVQTSATVDDMTQKVQVDIAQIQPTISLTSWQEKDF